MCIIAVCIWHVVNDLSPGPIPTVSERVVSANNCCFRSEQVVLALYTILNYVDCGIPSEGLEGAVNLSPIFVELTSYENLNIYKNHDFEDTICIFVLHIQSSIIYTYTKSIL